VLGLQFAEYFAVLRLAVGQRLAEGLLPARGDGGGMAFALAHVQAKEGADVADLDHMRPSVVLARPSHGTDRHTHVTKSRDTTPQDMRSTGGEGDVNSEGRAPHCGATKKVMEVFAAQPVWGRPSPVRLGLVGVQLGRDTLQSFRAREGFDVRWWKVMHVCRPCCAIVCGNAACSAPSRCPRTSSVCRSSPINHSRVTTGSMGLSTMAWYPASSPRETADTSDSLYRTGPNTVSSSIEAAISRGN
jgi:hypothetical protein